MASEICLQYGASQSVGNCFINKQLIVMLIRKSEKKNPATCLVIALLALHRLHPFVQGGVGKTQTLCSCKDRRGSLCCGWGPVL